MGKDKTSGMKSAYELALERLERQGIERPREDSVSDEVRAQIEEARRKAKAKVAELEILHRDRLAKLHDPVEREEELADFARERRKIEEDRDRKVAQLRGGG